MLMYFLHYKIKFIMLLLHFFLDPFIVAILSFFKSEFHIKRDSSVGKLLQF